MQIVDSKLQDNEHIIDTLYQCYKRDWSVIPVKLKEKTSIVKWKEYQHRKPTRHEFFEWEKTAEAIAVITGKINDIVILDVDQGGMESLKGKSLPITPVVRTQNGGFHYYFKYPGKKVNTAKGILPNVDVRGDGGYALIPFSKGYEWVEGLSLNDVEIAEMPQWFRDLSVSDKKVKEGVASNKYSLLAPPPKTNSNIQLLSTLNKGHLQNWYSSEQVAKTFLQSLGIKKDIGQAFHCILPGHSDKNPSSSLYKGDNGIYIYRDWHGSAHNKEEIVLLPEVYASMFYKKVVKMNSVDKELNEKQIGKPEFSVWAIRLLVDLGFIAPYNIKARQLPLNAKPTTKKVYEGLLLLFGCKWLYSPGDPTPFSWRFASAWCGVNQKKVGQAIQYLLAADYIELAGETSGRGRKMSLFQLKL